MLYNVDDLRAQAEQNRRQRQKGVDPALLIIERETAACYALAAAPAKRPAPCSQQLGDHADPIRQRELDAFFAARPDLTAADREAIAHMVHRASRTSSSTTPAPPSARPPPSRLTTHPHPLLNAVRHLFGLGDHSPPSSLKKIT